MLDLKQQLSGYIDASCPPVTAREVMGGIDRDVSRGSASELRSRRVLALCVAVVVAVIAATVIVYATREDETSDVVTTPDLEGSLVERLSGAEWERLSPGLGPGLRSGVVGWTGSELIISAPPVVAVYNPASNQLRRSSAIESVPATSMPIGAPLVRDRLPVWTGSELYLLGETNSARVDLSDPRRETPIASPPAIGSAVWTGSEIVVVTLDGGFGGSVYSPASNTWRPIARFASASGAFGIDGAVLVDGRLYIVARNEKGASVTMLSYAPDTDTWHELARTPTPTGGNGLLRPITLGEGIVVFDLFGNGYRYHVASDSWSDLPPLPGGNGGGPGKPILPLITFVVDDLIVAHSQDTLMILDVARWTWTTGPATPRVTGLVSTPGALYATTPDGSILRLEY